jgi:hypothetical protein
LEQLINLFFENNISFIDLLFLTRNVRNGWKNVHGCVRGQDTLQTFFHPIIF